MADDTTTNEPEINKTPGDAPKRGPGRPKGSTKANSAGPTETPIPGQPRGPGGRFGGKTAPPPVDVPLLARQLIGIHQMGAMMLGLPMLQLSPDEANLLAGALATVAREYDLSIDGKTGATLQLIAACAMVYVPRMIAIDQLVKAKRAQAAAPGNTGGGPSNVIDMATGEPVKPS